MRTHKHDRNSREITKLPTRPMQLQGQVKMVKVSDIRSDKLPGISFEEAVVSYFDILGFSDKKENEDIELCLLDFSAPLAMAADNYPNVRFNVFSDCAFITAPVDKTQELLASIRYAFTQWIADGILVRGGIALGEYKETRSFTLSMSGKHKNFNGSLFSGSGVTEAVKLEGAGTAALLFTNEDTASFLSRKYKEPIFTLDKRNIIGWFDDQISLFWFTGVSFLRLLRLLQHGYSAKQVVVQKLNNNLRYSFVVAPDRIIPISLIMALISLPVVTDDIKKKSCKLFGIKDPDDFVYYKKLIDSWLSKKEMQLLRVISDFDSSIPGYTLVPKFE